MFENKLFPYNSVLKLTITNMTPMEDSFPKRTWMPIHWQLINIIIADEKTLYVHIGSISDAFWSIILGSIQR